mmetsp:Transcript_6028/g.9573  ORF Transcript_6028/g.9573 Transcript_6028/m.9573 type:complete len:464 (-) Transcript_6028:103-1494(-)
MDQELWGDDANNDTNADDSKNTNPFSTGGYQSDNEDNDGNVDAKDMTDTDIILNEDVDNDDDANANAINGHDNKLHDIAIRGDASQANLLSYFGDSDGTQQQINIVDVEERKSYFSKIPFTIYVIEWSSHRVSRRYNDFKWLYNQLGLEYVGLFIPSLPPAHTFERFKDAVITQRRFDLQRFLNRIHNDSVLCMSEHLKLFLTEPDEQLFEEKKKMSKQVLTERSQSGIISLLRSTFSTLDAEPIPEFCLGFNDEAAAQCDEKDDFNKLYQLDMPRVREYFMRCEERLSVLILKCQSLFKAFSAVSTELATVNTDLNALYEAEYNEQPMLVLNRGQERFNVRQFMNDWKETAETQTTCVYKYVLLALRYEHEDIVSILDTFKRYDHIYGRYKTSKRNLNRQREKYPDKDYTKEHHVLSETQDLLNLICKIIIVNQTPQVWQTKIDAYNRYMQSLMENLTLKTL